jgi:uncharacterized protein
LPEEDRYLVPSRIFILFGVVLALGLIGAGWVLGLQIKQTKLGEHYVTVKGLVERSVKSDLAIWSISFRSSGDDFKTVLAAGESQKQIVLGFLKKQGIREDDIAISPPNVLDREAQEFGSVQGRQSRYVLTQNIVVTSKDVDRIAAANQRIGDLLQQGVILGGGQGVGGSQLSFKFNGLNSIKPDMITEATKNARAAAERFAQDAGAKVGSIRQANQGSFSISAADAGASADEGGNFTNSDVSLMKTVRAVTTVEYYLLQ